MWLCCSPSYSSSCLWFAIFGQGKKKVSKFTDRIASNGVCSPLQLCVGWLGKDLTSHAIWVMGHWGLITLLLSSSTYSPTLFLYLHVLSIRATTMFGSTKTTSAIFVHGVVVLAPPLYNIHKKPLQKHVKYWMQTKHALLHFWEHFFPGNYNHPKQIVYKATLLIAAHLMTVLPHLSNKEEDNIHVINDAQTWITCLTIVVPPHTLPFLTIATRCSLCQSVPVSPVLLVLRIQKTV